jgi:hypothetical protein
MKLIHISALLLFLFVFSFVGYSQVEDEEVQIFSIQGQPQGTRSIDPKQYLDFGIMKKEIKIIKIDVNNTGNTDMKLGRVTIPEGVGVIVINEVIKPGQKGEIAVMVDPKFMKKGAFKKDITFSAITEEKGSMVTKTVVFGIKGQIQ